MAEAGILSEDDRVELIEGEILEMAPIGLRHARCVNNLTRAFSRLVDQVVLQVQNPILLDPDSEVQPDITLLRLRDYSHDQQHPGPTDVLLAVEVSDTTLLWDRREKVPLYARAGIPEVWIVNLQQDRIELYSQPEGGAYQTTRRLRRGQSLAVPGAPNTKVKVDDVLGNSGTN
ncbi:MAG: Uma2 family endonuclease [Chloroflexota bacterium]|nr:Uma2 family endonuclease [Chloroflexota bacterium]